MSTTQYVSQSTHEVNPTIHSMFQLHCKSCPKIQCPYNILIVCTLRSMLKFERNPSFISDMFGNRSESSRIPTPPSPSRSSTVFLVSLEFWLIFLALNIACQTWFCNYPWKTKVVLEDTITNAPQKMKGIQKAVHNHFFAIIYQNPKLSQLTALLCRWTVHSTKNWIKGQNPFYIKSLNFIILEQRGVYVRVMNYMRLSLLIRSSELKLNYLCMWGHPWKI